MENLQVSQNSCTFVAVLKIGNKKKNKKKI